MSTDVDLGFDLDFGGLKKAAAGKPKKEYPELPDPDGSVAKVVDQLHQAEQQEKAAKGTKELCQQILKDSARPFYFDQNYGLGESKNAVAAFGSDRHEVLIQFKAAYTKITDLKPIATLIGSDLTRSFFKQVFDLKFKSELVPVSKQPELLRRVKELCQELEIPDAVEVNAYYKPTDEFATARHKVLSPEQNVELEKTFDKGLQIIAVASSRGRK